MEIADWYYHSTLQERKDVAREMNTTTVYLYQMAHNLRSITPCFAIRLEAATKKVTPNMVVYQIDSCDTCASCPYATRG